MVLMILVAGVLGSRWFGSRALRQWKEQAIARIEARLQDTNWVEREAKRLVSARVDRRISDGWIGEEMLAARNGEWIVFQSVAGKEQRPGIGRDLFIGRGSDGKWYYSSFHFCIRMESLRIEEQPDTLAQLVEGHWLVSFDGKSDECFKTTRSGGAYGDAKVMAGQPASNP